MSTVVLVVVAVVDVFVMVFPYGSIFGFVDFSKSSLLLFVGNAGENTLTFLVFYVGDSCGVGKAVE